MNVSLATPMQDESSIIERHLIEMFTLAGEYCITIENAEHSTKEELFSFLSKISPMLYLRGLLFPPTEEPDEEGNERIVTEEQWENIFNTLRNKFGSDDTFNYLESNFPNNLEVSKGSLSEIFTDVYQDMKDFVWLMTKQSTIARLYAAFNIRQFFLSNWGSKILLAQMIMHSRLIESRPEPDYSDLE